LRLPAEVHQSVARAAEREALSINEYCVRRLTAAASPHTAHRDLRALLARAETVTPGRVVGLVLHGSWPRGEARASSDVDILVVVEASVALTRALYQRWDESPVSWDSRPVDVHFIHLPADADHSGGVWCEVAIEGRVLVDPDGRVERALVDIRRAIADGRLQRKRAHGQPYWTRVA
jgi:predicted nucleotidyltransferase